jgi:predicted transcriptional regulator
MNKDVLLSLGKLKGIESAEIISSSIFSAISENAQETYSEQMDQTTDFGYSNFSGLYEDLLQNEYTEEQIGAKIEEVAEPMIDAYSKKYADIQQISYSTETYDEIREQVSQIVYAQIEEDLTTIGEASEMSMAEFAEQLQANFSDEEEETQPEENEETQPEETQE